MRRMTVLLSVILIVAACGGADDTSGTTSEPATTSTSSSADITFNQEVLDRFRITDIGGLDPDSADSSGRISAFLQPVSPAEGAVKYICGDELPDGYVLTYSFGPAGGPPNAPALIEEFKAFATETYCP